MFATSFDESNCVLSVAEDMKEECSCLSVLRITDQNNNRMIISCWKMTKEELEEINKTGRIWLSIIGDVMPVTGISGVKPFEITNK